MSTCSKILAGLAIFCAIFICSQYFIFSAFAYEYDEMAIAQEEPQFGTGHLPEPIEPTYVAPPLISTYSILPSSVDLSADIYFPDIVSQGRYGACSSYATTYYQFTYAAARLNNWAMKGNDIDRRFSPRYTYNFCNDGADSGSSIWENIYVLHQGGSVKMSEFNLNPNQYDVTLIRQWCTDTKAVRNALNTRVSDYAYERFAEEWVSRPLSTTTARI